MLQLTELLQKQIIWTTNGNSNKNIQVSTNGTSWSSKTSSTGGTELATLSNGAKLYIRGNGVVNNYSGASFSSTGNFSLQGNIMSMVTSANTFNKIDVIESDDAFYGLFKNCTTLISAQKLRLFANITSSECYAAMFNGCTNLTEAPELLAPTVSDSCYSNMFADCTSLVSAPSVLLPNNLNGAIWCYAHMFTGCTSLTTAPILLATRLGNGSYMFMFDGCTSLDYIKCLATDISANDCTWHWVRNVASSGTFVKAASMSSWTSGNDGIPNGWTVQDAT